MKLQNLVIIFLLIILPMMLVYTINYNGQMKTLRLQAQYNESLKNATYDAIKAFEENTLSDSLSGNAESKRDNIKAAMNMYIKSLAASSGFSAYNENDIKEYIPAVVFGLYDGFYMYAPTINNSGSYEPMLKNFVYYSERITGTDIVIRYSLDNYVAVSGTINGTTYGTWSGYLEANVDAQINLVDEENLYENIIVEVEKNSSNPNTNFEYEYYLIPCTYKYNDGKKIYKKVNNGEILKLTNNSPTETNIDLKQIKWEKNYYNDGIDNKFYTENSSNKYLIIDGDKWYTYSDYKLIQTADPTKNTDDSAKEYYTKAKKFTEWWNNNIASLNSSLQVDSSNDPENPNSNFSIHKKSIMKDTIQNNLNTAIAAYANRQTITGKKFKMPVIAPEDWEKVYSNVSVITFLQGIDIGYTEYNNYSVQNSTNHNEYPNPNNLYFIIGNNCDTSGTYHDIRCTNTVLTGYKSNEFNGIRIVTQPIASWTIDPQNKVVTTFNNKIIYYYRHLALACYECINCAYSNKEDIYEYINNTASDDVKRAYWTALARERYNTPKTTDNFKDPTI